jgi:hypothetical protein
MSVSDLIAQLDAIIARFRYVKYGDIWLSADHNDPIDAIKKLREIVSALSQVTAAPIEGDYSTWTLMWKRYYGYDGAPAPTPNQLSISESLDLLILADGQRSNMQMLKLSDGTLLSETPILHSDYHSFIVPSALAKYFAVVVVEADVPKLKIYKDASLIQTIDLSATLGWTTNVAECVTVFSRDGKYLFVSNNYYAGPKEYALFKGS